MESEGDIQCKGHCECRVLVAEAAQKLVECEWNASGIGYGDWYNSGRRGELVIVTVIIARDMP